MIPILPPDANKLTEPSAIALLTKLEQRAIATPLRTEPVATIYVRHGQGGIPLLLLHGFDSSVLEFRRLLPLLAVENEAWAVDLLGFGFTERSATLAYGSEAIRTHLYAVWQTLIQQPVILVGASMGGAVALDFTLTYPEAVRKLVLIDSAGLANPPLLSKLMFFPFDTLATEFLRRPQVRQSISRAAYYDKSLATLDAYRCAALHLQQTGWNRALAAFTKSGGYGSFANRLSEIVAPTLILWGTDDRILGTKDAHKFEQAISHSKLAWVENCGHVPHLEKPQVTAQEILKYCHEG
ncbi:MAG: alpha/beta fold hydrolase [Cyanophyceae cyanobacterium]